MKSTISLDYTSKALLHLGNDYFPNEEALLDKTHFSNIHLNVKGSISGLLNRNDVSIFRLAHAYTERQKSRHTSGGAGEVHARCVKSTPASDRVGSEYQDVPRPPSQPNEPSERPSSSRSVATAKPKPQP